MLVGMPGTGKSTVAPMLAAELGCDSSDLDSLIEHVAGRSVPELFNSVGEAGFRDLEFEALSETLRGAPVVLATGGGVVTSPDARAELRECTVVWLRARPETLMGRLSGDGNTARTRPLLATDDPGVLSRRIEELTLERTALYEEVADIVVDVEDRTPEQVAQAILVLLSEDES